MAAGLTCSNKEWVRSGPPAGVSSTGTRYLDDCRSQHLGLQHPGLKSGTKCCCCIVSKLNGHLEDKTGKRCREDGDYDNLEEQSAPARGREINCKGRRGGQQEMFNLGLWPRAGASGGAKEPA